MAFGTSALSTASSTGWTTACTADQHIPRHALLCRAAPTACVMVNVMGPFSECSPAGSGLGTRGEAVSVGRRPWARTDPASDALHPRHSIRLRWLPSESGIGAHVERVPARTCPQPHASREHPHHAFDGNSGVQRLHYPFADRGARGRQCRGHGDRGLPRDLRRALLRRAFEPVADKRG